VSKALPKYTYRMHTRGDCVQAPVHEHQAEGWSGATGKLHGQGGRRREAGHLKSYKQQGGRGGRGEEGCVHKYYKEEGQGTTLIRKWRVKEGQEV
jgi:hypothetical protein